MAPVIDSLRELVPVIARTHPAFAGRRRGPTALQPSPIAVKQRPDEAHVRGLRASVEALETLAAEVDAAVMRMTAELGLLNDEWAAQAARDFEARVSAYMADRNEFVAALKKVQAFLEDEARDRAEAGPASAQGGSVS